MDKLKSRREENGICIVVHVQRRSARLPGIEIHVTEGRNVGWHLFHTFLRMY